VKEGSVCVVFSPLSLYRVPILLVPSAKKEKIEEAQQAQIGQHYRRLGRPCQQQKVKSLECALRFLFFS
jgi:hypothetical protein